MSAHRLFDYRLFCGECDDTCDVRGVDARDAEREARKAGWRASAPEPVRFGPPYQKKKSTSPTIAEVLCPLCWRHLQHREPIPVHESTPGAS